MHTLRLPLHLILLLCLAACSPLPAARTEEPAMPAETAASPEPGRPPDPALTPLAERARSDLAGRLGIAATEISVSEARAVTWPDSSLGCPQPGMAYSQVLTAGYLVVLQAGGAQYEYHAGQDGKAFYCEGPVPPVPGEAGDT